MEAQWHTGFSAPNPRKSGGDFGAGFGIRFADAAKSLFQ